MTRLLRVHLCLIVMFSLTGCLEHTVDLDDPDEEKPPSEKPPEPEPRVVELTPYARTIAAAGSLTCALDEDEEVICWGPEGTLNPFEGRYTELAAGQTESGTDWALCAVGDETYRSSCVANYFSMRRDVVHIGVGSLETQCYQHEDDTLLCFGLDDYELPVVADFDAMIGQGESFCGLKLGEPPVCWGAPLPETPTSDRVAFTSQSHWCQIGEGEVECAEGVEFQSPVTDALQIAAGPEMVCVLDEKGALFCDGTNRALSEMPSESARFVEIAVGQAHGCGIDADGKFACWGTWVAGTDEILAEAPSDVQAF